jgi:hypothetical protein
MANDTFHAGASFKGSMYPETDLSGMTPDARACAGMGCA